MRRLCFAGSFARARVGQLKASSLVWCWWGWSTPSCPQDRGGLAGWAPGQSRGTPPVRGGSAVRPGPESRHAPGQRRVGWVPRARVAAGPRSETGRAGASCQSRGMPPVRGGSDGCSGPESRHALGQRWGRPCAPGQSRGTPPVRGGSDGCPGPESRHAPGRRLVGQVRRKSAKLGQKKEASEEASLVGRAGLASRRRSGGAKRRGLLRPVEGEARSDQNKGRFGKSANREIKKEASEEASLVGRAGLEPATIRLKVECSTN